MSKEIDIDVIMNYNNLDTVIEGLIELRNKHGGKCSVDHEVDWNPYEECSGQVRVYLTVPDNAL